MRALLLDRGNRANGSEAPAAAPPRRIERRVPLPGGRAVVGGLLVTLAAVGVFVSWAAAGEDVTRPVVVAAADIRPGEVIGADDVEVRSLELPAALADGAYADPQPLVGAVAVAPLAEGELVQRSAVAERGVPVAGSIPAAEL